MGDIIWGARAIAKTLNTTEKTIFHKLERGQLPGARKIGGRWCLHLPTFYKVFSREENDHR